MGEFGHQAAIGDGFAIDAWGEGPFLITAENGRVYRFGDSDRFGPYLADKHGDPTKNPYPRERDPFWRAHRIWVRQGRRLFNDTAIWTKPKPTTFIRLGKRSGFIKEAGEEDGKCIEVTGPLPALSTPDQS